MKVTHTATYHAPMAEVYAMLTDPALGVETTRAVQVETWTSPADGAAGAAWPRGDR